MTTSRCSICSGYNSQYEKVTRTRCNTHVSLRHTIHERDQHIPENCNSQKIYTSWSACTGPEKTQTSTQQGKGLTHLYSQELEDMVDSVLHHEILRMTAIVKV